MKSMELIVNGRTSNMMADQSSIEVLIGIDFGSDGMNMLIQTIEVLSSLFDDLKKVSRSDH
jgi:hypothetical protein